MRVNPKLEGFVKKNGATILTCVGAAGVVGTSVLTFNATTKANKLLEEAKKEQNTDLTLMDKVKITLPTYIPPILAGTATIACIIGANIMNKKYQASLMSAYMLLDQSYKEYRNKVTEVYGEEAEQIIEESIASDHCPR